MNDNLTLLMLLEQQALNFIEELDARGKHLWLWWCTFDAKKTAVARRPELLQTWIAPQKSAVSGKGRRACDLAAALNTSFYF